jgi:hypothetical protein
MAGTVWVFLVAAGLAFLWLVGRIGHPTGKAVAVRAAHLALLGAGTVGAAGWLGSWTRAGLAWIVRVAGAGTSAAVGTNAVVGIAALGLCLAWVLGMLPSWWIRFDPPDWLAWAGLVLPALAVQIPGPVGSLVSGVITGAGSLVVVLGRTAVGA